MFFITNRSELEVLRYHIKQIAGGKVEDPLFSYMKMIKFCIEILY